MPNIKRAFKALREVRPDTGLSSYSFCTDGSESAGRRGIPTIGFGPSKEGVAHTNDEYIEVNELLKACEGYRAIIEKF